MTIVLPVLEEVSVTRERLDTIERLLDAKGTISRADIAAYLADEPEILAEQAAGSSYDELLREVR